MGVADTTISHAALAAQSGAKTVAFPVGTVTDAPGWDVRGFMLDAGRHWFDTTFLGESWFLIVLT